VEALRVALEAAGLGQLGLGGGVVLREGLPAGCLHDLPGGRGLVHSAGVRATAVQADGVATLVGVGTEVGNLLACAGALELLVRLDVVVLSNQMWGLGFLRRSDAPAVRGGLVSVRLLEVAWLLRVLQLHRAQVARSGPFLVRLRAVALHLLHLRLHLRLCLSLVHALAHEHVHQQDLLLAGRD